MAQICFTMLLIIWRCGMCRNCKARLALCRSACSSARLGLHAAACAETDAETADLAVSNVELYQEAYAKPGFSHASSQVTDLRERSFA
jgi:hypothetical protein